MEVSTFALFLPPPSPGGSRLQLLPEYERLEEISGLQMVCGLGQTVEKVRARSGCRQSPVESVHCPVGESVGNWCRLVLAPVGFDQSLYEVVPVRLVQEDAIALIATAPDVINGTRILELELAGHGGNIGLIELVHQG